MPRRRPRRVPRVQVQRLGAEGRAAARRARPPRPRGRPRAGRACGSGSATRRGGRSRPRSTSTTSWRHAATELDAYHDELLERARTFRDEHSAPVDDWDAFVAQVDDRASRTRCTAADHRARTTSRPRPPRPRAASRWRPARSRRLHPVRHALGLRQACRVRPRLLSGAGMAAGVEVSRASVEDWADVRDLPLAALADTPDAFGATLEEEQDRPEAWWRARLEPADRVTLLARLDRTPVGLTVVAPCVRRLRRRRDLQRLGRAGRPRPGCRTSPSGRGAGGRVTSGTGGCCSTSVTTTSRHSGSTPARDSGRRAGPAACATTRARDRARTRPDAGVRRWQSVTSPGSRRRRSASTPPDGEGNNDRAWFDANRPVYEHAVRLPMEELLARADEDGFGDGKVFRPNRDVRFSQRQAALQDPLRRRHPPRDGTARAGRYVQLNATGMRAAAATGSCPATSSRGSAWRSTTADVAACWCATSAPRGPPGTRCSAPSSPAARVGSRSTTPASSCCVTRRLAVSRSWPVAPWMHTAEAFDRIAEVWRDAAPIVRWLEQHVGAAAGATPTARRRPMTPLPSGVPPTPDRAAMATIVLVRHATTPATGKRLGGWTPGVHLDAAGEAQASRDRGAPRRRAADGRVRLAARTDPGDRQGRRGAARHPRPDPQGRRRGRLRRLDRPAARPAPQSCAVEGHPADPVAGDLPGWRVDPRRAGACRRGHRAARRRPRRRDDRRRQPRRRHQGGRRPLPRHAARHLPAHPHRARQRDACCTSPTGRRRSCSRQRHRVRTRRPAGGDTDEGHRDEGDGEEGHGEEGHREEGRVDGGRR